LPSCFLVDIVAHGQSAKTHTFLSPAKMTVCAAQSYVKADLGAAAAKVHLVRRFQRVVATL